MNKCKHFENEIKMSARMSKGRAAPPEPCVELSTTSPVTSLAFSTSETPEDKGQLFSGHQDGKVIYWNLVTQRPTSSNIAHSDSVIWLSWVSNKLISQGRDGFIRFWIRSDSEWTRIGEVTCAALTFCNMSMCLYNNQHILTAPGNPTAQLIVYHLPNLSSVTEITSQSSPHKIQPSQAKVFGMCMRTRSAVQTAQLPSLLVAYESGTLALWNLVTDELLSKVAAHSESIMCMDCWVSQETGLFRCITGSVDNQLRSWQVKDYQLVQENTVFISNPGLCDIAVREDGRIAATGGWDHFARVFTVKKLRALAVLGYHHESVQCVMFAPDKTLATGSKDGHIALWDIYKDK
ncbi:unnamed protein product [Lymnaea stagnalis]|uniref:Guanine nucleotide-binding protein subunit beta-like protein 1 n=1 Tax=Lymnaea stagnalis TaxID=6523 RepID=A0AAV2IFB8_LYMST